ncbi:MAG: hypothetical protein ABSG19_06630 [Candidatus Aminicenantales bacterium]
MSKIPSGPARLQVLSLRRDAGARQRGGLSSYRVFVKRAVGWTMILVLSLLWLASSSGGNRENGTAIASSPAGELTPSKSHYFDWINSQYEGTTEAQTLVNMEFFQWLHDEFGMTLDVYSLDVGNIDDGPYTAGVGRLIPYHYGTLSSEEFKAQFPRGFAPLVKKAAGFGGRLGVWMGPDGFGDTPEEEKARVDMLVSLCRDHNFIAFKIDAVAGQLRPEKQEVFRRAVEACRAYRPDLMIQNHRVKLGVAAGVASVSLWEGVETYIDVFMPNSGTAAHHRAGALARELPPNLTRRLEDHGVCLSSCLDYWEDDLVLQAFNRCLLLAPSIYGNPWLLRDDEFPRLARIFNLHRKYRDILTSGIVLPEARYGPSAVSRGDGATRFITLRNLTWNPVTYGVRLDETLGLATSREIEVRRFHPSESVLGRFPWGSDVAVEVPPFRSCLIAASSRSLAEIGVEGCDYDVVRETPGKPAIVNLLGAPGAGSEIRLTSGGRKFRRAVLDGVGASLLLEGKALRVDFPGRRPKTDWHRKIGDLEPCPVPADAEALFEATCFAADNNALEVRSLLRSGPSAIPQVDAARTAFFSKPMFVNRGIWDRNLFDGRIETAFVARLAGRSFRLDFGRPLRMDRIVLKVRDRQAADLSPDLDSFGKDAAAEVSADLETWVRLAPAWGGKGTIAVLKTPSDRPVRYLRVSGAPRRLSEVEAYLGGEPLDRSAWRASNLFHPYALKPAVAAWRLTFKPEEVSGNAYLAVALNGNHGDEGAYAALRVDGRPVGAQDRAVSFPSNTWEYHNVEKDGNYTYYFPLPESTAGKTVDIVVLILQGGTNGVKPEAWMTSYPAPRAKRELVLYE